MLSIEVVDQHFEPWSEFLEKSANATLFHELSFLDYHGEGLFEMHHLVVRDQQRIVSVVPAGLRRQNGAQWLASPVGASVGGPVLNKGVSVQTVTGVLEAIQSYARDLELAGVTFTVAPGIYWSPPSDTLGFSLAATGFGLEHRWLCYVADIGQRADGNLVAELSKTRRYEVRKAAKTLRIREVIPPAWGSLYEILLDNQTALGSMPTHTEADLLFLKERFPDRVRLFLCSDSDTDIAGVVVFKLNSRVAYVFYIFERQAHRGSHAATLTVDHVMRVMSSEGVRYLDLGPTSYEDHVLNDGLAFFKESFGAFGVCRDRWIWSNLHHE